VVTSAVRGTDAFSGPDRAEADIGKTKRSLAINCHGLQRAQGAVGEVVSSRSRTCRAHRPCMSVDAYGKTEPGALLPKGRWHCHRGCNERAEMLISQVLIPGTWVGSALGGVDLRLVICGSAAPSIFIEALAKRTQFSVIAESCADWEEPTERPWQ
jgi:hypothetical protein